MESDVFFGFVCSELKVLSDHPSSLLELKIDLHASHNSKSLRGEILSLRKILDAHFHMNSSKYDWEDELPIDTDKHCEEMISQDRVSATTLVFYWTSLKKNVMDIFTSLESFHNEEPKEHEGPLDFSLNYFGVRKECVKGKTVYLLVNKDADWIRNAGQKGLHMEGKRLIFDGQQLRCVIWSYWKSELLSVGIKVLETLESLYKSKSNGSAFHQSTSLLYLCEVSRFLIDCEFLDLTSPYKKKLQSFLEISSKYFDIVFPLDWRKSMSEDLISLRNSPPSVFCLLDIIDQNIDVKRDITYWTIGKAMMICLGYRKPSVHHQMLSKGLKWNPAWKSFVDAFCICGLKDADVAPEFQMVLDKTFKANMRRPGYISPHSFLYLLDSYLFFASFSSGTFFSTKSSLIGWLTQFDSSATPSTILPELKRTIQERDVYFIVKVVKQILSNTKDTVSWIQRSKISPTYYHPLLALKLVMMMSLICLQVSGYSKLLLDLLSGENNVAYLLPQKFVRNLLKKKKNGSHLGFIPKVVAEAFVNVDDPLVVASSETLNQITDAPCATFVDLRESKEEIINVLFPKKNTNSVQISSTNVDVGTNCVPSSSNTLRDANLKNVIPVEGSKNEEQQQMCRKGDRELNDAMTEVIRSALKPRRTEEEDFVNMTNLHNAVKMVVENRSDQPSNVIVYEPPWLTTEDGCKGELDMNWEVLENISDSIRSRGLSQKLSVERTRMELRGNIYTLAAALEDGQSISRKISKLVHQASRELEALYSTFDPSRRQLPCGSTVQAIVERLQSMRPMLDHFLKHTIYRREPVDVEALMSTSSSTTEFEEVGDGNTEVAEEGNSKGKKSKKNKGKKK